MSGINRRDLEFAFQLEELRLVEQMSVFDDRQRARIAQLYALVEGLCEGLTNAEAQLADLRDVYESLAEIKRTLATGRRAHNMLVGRVNNLAAKLEEVRTLAARTNQRFG